MVRIIIISLFFLINSCLSSLGIMEIGYETDNETFELSGSGTFFSTNIVRLGYKGNSNSFNILNGAAATADSFYLGMTSTDGYHGDGIPAAYNEVHISGSGSLLNAGSVWVGYGPESRNNSLFINNGGQVTADSCVVGISGGDNNRLIVTGAGSALTVSGAPQLLTVGYLGGGHSMIVSNGASVTSRAAVLANGYSIYECEENEILITGNGSQWNSGDFTLATGDYAIDNTFRVQDGGKTVSENVVVGDEGASGNQAVLSGDGSEWNVSGSFTMHAGYAGNSANAITIESGARLSIGGVLLLNDEYASGMTASRINLNDGGTLVLGSDFNVSGPGFNFNEGSVLHAKANLTGLAEVGADRTLIAHQLTGSLLLQGCWAIGDGITNGNITGNLNIADIGMLAMEIAAAGNDELEVQGDTVLGGTLQLTASDGLIISYGSSYQLFDWHGSVTGSFDALYCDALSEGLSWDTSELYTTGQLHVVPEPATAGLMGLSALSLYMLRVNRRRFGTCRYFLRFRRSAIRTPVSEGW